MGNPLTRRFAPPSPGGRGIYIAPLSDEAYASNRRTADALGKYKGVGDLPRFTTDAINTNGEKAVHEVADLIGQVHGRSPDQAKELFDKTAQGIAPENRTLLKQAMDGHIENLKTESPDAGSPSAPPQGASMDEHGNWFDKEGKPIGNPGLSPDVHQAQVAVPMPGAVPPPPGTIGQPTPEDIQKMMDRYGREFRDWWNDKTGGSARTDQAPQLPNQETFPADQGDPTSGIQKGRPTEPDRVINPPPYEMPKPGQYNTPPSEDQRDKLDQMIILEMGRKQDLKQMDAAADALGIDRKTFGKRLHAIKGGAKGDVRVDRSNGDVYDKDTDEWIGNLHDED